MYHWWMLYIPGIQSSTKADYGGSGHHCVYVTSFGRQLTPLRKLSAEKTPKETTEEDVTDFYIIIFFCEKMDDGMVDVLLGKQFSEPFAGRMSQSHCLWY